MSTLSSMLAINFQFSFRFLTIIQWDLEWRKEDICILCIYVFCGFFLVIFFSHIDSNPLRRWAVPPSAILWISYWLPCVFLKYLSVLFLMLTSAPIITGSLIVLKYHIFSISFSRPLYLFILLYFLTGYLLSVGTEISVRRHVLVL